MKTALLLALLHFCACQDRPPRRCHACQGDCDAAAVEECPSVDDSCYALVLQQNGSRVESRGCADAADAVCSRHPDALSCYTCQRDRCNDVGHLGVKECFVCVDQCQNPLARHDCQEALTEKEGRPTKAACLRFSVERETGVEESRGCVRDDPIVSATCLGLNFQKGVSCQVCKEDLCNRGGEVGEGVRECYYCFNDCDRPLSRQNCTEELGEGVRSRCGTIDAVIGGQEVEARACIEDSDATTSYCDMINQMGGNCTLCDTELCNNISEEEGEKGVQECYFCSGECKKPLEKQNCTVVLGEDVKSRCVVVDAEISGERVKERRCVEDSDATTSYCDMINQMGGNCTLCDTDLCNKINGGRELYPLVSLVLASFVALVSM